MAEERELNYRERCFVILRNIGCPEAIAKRMLTGARGEARTDVRRAEESFEDFFQRTNPAKYARMMQRQWQETERRYALHRAARIGAQVARDIANDFK
jgi:hypothetical protein